MLEDEKTFGVTHEYLHNLGFELFKLTTHSKWYFKTKRKLKYYSGQEIFCDFIYFRTIDSISENKQIWNEDKGIKTILTLLLYDLTDPAAAYLEKMETENILPKETSAELYELIMNWEGAVNFIYKTDILHKFQSYLNFFANFALIKITNYMKSANNSKN